MKYYRTDELYHHGIKGQKWGVRRYQNSDGTLTDAGKKRRKIQENAVQFAKNSAKAYDEDARKYQRKADLINKRAKGTIGFDKNSAAYNEGEAEFNRKMAKDWMRRAKKWESMPIEEMKGSEWRKIQHYGRQYLKYYGTHE